MRAIISGLLRQAFNRGWNSIQCDRCGAIQTLDRRYSSEECRAEARLNHGWMCLQSRSGEPDGDFCPACAAADCPDLIGRRVHLWEPNTIGYIVQHHTVETWVLMMTLDQKHGVSDCVCREPREIRPLIRRFEH